MEKRTVINKGWLVLIGFTPIWLTFAFFAFLNNETLVSVILAAVGLLFLILSYFSPNKYVFDNDGISICFLNSKRQRFLWKNIGRVACHTEYTNKGGKYFVYKIYGKSEFEKSFFMNSTLPKSKKIKSFFNEYIADKLVDFTEIPKFRKNDPECDIFKYILNLEKFTRENVEKYIEPFYSEFKDLGLSYKVKFAYFSDDEDYIEYIDRPKGKSSYSAFFEISKPNETNEDMIIKWETALVEVDTNKLKPKNFVDSEMILISLMFLDDMVADVKLNGFDEYMNDDFTETDE